MSIFSKLSVLAALSSLCISVGAVPMTRERPEWKASYERGTSSSSQSELLDHRDARVDSLYNSDGTRDFLAGFGGNSDSTPGCLEGYPTYHLYGRHPREQSAIYHGRPTLQQPLVGRATTPNTVFFPMQGNVNLIRLTKAVSVHRFPPLDHPNPLMRGLYRMSGTQMTTQEFDQHIGGLLHYYSQPNADWSHTLIVDPTFKSNGKEDLVYNSLDENQKAIVTEHVYKVRPYTLAALKPLLSRYLKEDDAHALLLSSDIRRIHGAVENMFPIHKKKQQNRDVHWMSGLQEWQRIAVIRKMARVLQQGEDEVRDLFIRLRVTPQMALDVLASDEEGCKNIGEPFQAYFIEHNDHGKWMQGSSEFQRKLIKQRMLLQGSMTAAESGRLLSQLAVPRGFGLHILYANDQKFERMMLFLRELGLQLNSH
jgi:hypothetical protein